MFLPGFPAPDGDRVQWFVGQLAAQPQVWTKPRGCTVLFALCVGGGGGGGGGANSSVSGAGGGGSGSWSYAAYLLADLPDSLILRLGVGGLGGAAGSNGSTGGFSTLVIPANIYDIGNRLLIGNGGGGGQSAGTAGSAGAASLASDGPLGQCALFFRAYAGSIGGAGSTVKPSILTPSGLTCGGAGGAGSTAADGGDIDVIGPVPKVVGGIYPGGAGSSLVQRLPVHGMFRGGSGGASGDPAAVVGGAGGDGGYGCGGGGGGASSAGGGNGGNGGPGLIIMACR